MPINYLIHAIKLLRRDYVSVLDSPVFITTLFSISTSYIHFYISDFGAELTQSKEPSPRLRFPTRDIYTFNIAVKQLKSSPITTTYLLTTYQKTYQPNIILPEYSPPAATATPPRIFRFISLPAEHRSLMMKKRLSDSTVPPEWRRESPRPENLSLNSPAVGHKARRCEYWT